MQKTTKLTLFLLLFTLATSIASAYPSYNQNLAQSHTRTTYSTENYKQYSWENQERYPVYDYRYGYSYRATREYREDKTEHLSRRTSNKNTKGTIFQEEPYYYYEYSDYMRTYNKYECYINPPKNKLIYAKCP